MLVSQVRKKKAINKCMQFRGGGGVGVLTKKKRWHDINHVACFRQI